MRPLLNSPVLTTWLAQSVRIGGAIVVIPLALRRFAPEDMALWLLFSTISGLQLLADFGFSQTFSRFVAYGNSRGDAAAVGGSTIYGHEGLAVTAVAMARVYRHLVAASSLLLLVLGTWAVASPVGLSSSPRHSWIAWSLVILGTGFSIYANRYVAYLVGANQIALQNRWDAILGAGQLLSQLAVLYFEGSVLGLVAVSQAWIIASFALNRWLFRRLAPPDTAPVPPADEVRRALRRAWTAAWRSALGIGLGFGVMQVSTVVFANLLPSAEAASFLLGLRLMQILSQFSQAPFYVKLPLLAGLRSRGHLAELTALAQSSMRNSYLVYAIGFGIIGLTGGFALEAAGSQTSFPSGMFWAVLGLGVMAERYGGMHIQLYSTTNHIIWHKANGIFALCFVPMLLLLQGTPGGMPYAIAMASANIVSYAPFSAAHSYRSLDVAPLEFEKKAALVPALSFLLIFTLIVAIHG